MNNKKEFLGILISVLICVCAVSVFVYATTTVGDSIIIGTDLTVTSGARIGNSAETSHITILGDGTLFVERDAEFDGTVYFDGDVAIKGTGTEEPATEFSVVGTASISEDLWASGSFQFGGGEAMPTVSYSRLGSATTGHSLSNSNDLLISGNTETNGTAYFDGLVSVSDANGLMIGGGASLFGGTASPDFACTQGSWYFRTGQSASASLYFCGATNAWEQVIGIDVAY